MNIRKRSLVVFLVAFAACDPGRVERDIDARVDSGTSETGSVDVSHADVQATDTQPVDVTTSDALSVPGCDPVPGSVTTIRVMPDPALAPNAITVDVTGPTGWTFVDLNLRSASMTLSGRLINVTGTYVWHWSVDTTYPGDYCVSFTTDHGANTRARVPLHIGGTAPMPGGYVTRAGSELMVDGSRLRFIGMNLRGLPHYGTPLLRYATTAQIDTELAEVQRMGARVVRVFAAANDSDANTVGARLGVVLDAAQRHGLHVIAALTDYYNTGFSPQGDDGFYDTSSGFSIPLLNQAFYGGGFRTNYLPWVRAVVGRFQNHTALLAWELGNEIKHDANHAAFASFATEVAGVIRSLDSHHLIASGMITSAWMTPAEATAFYADRNMDIITVHTYDGSHAFDDSWLSSTVGKPMIIEEAGWQSGDRASEASTDVAYWVDGHAARGYMQWGFTVVTPDNGNGDRLFGMDHLAHAGDYDAMFSAFASEASRIR